MVGKMFEFIDDTFNPLGGECSHKCVGCWARAQAARFKIAKYQGEPRLIQWELKRKFTAGQIIFVCDMCDLFSEQVPREMICRIFQVIKEQPDVTFLLLTKNPIRMRRFVVTYQIPHNCILGATIESNRGHEDLTKAPGMEARLAAMKYLAELPPGTYPFKRFISVEPIKKFDLELFVKELIACKPDFGVAVGYDGYGNHFPEPTLLETQALIGFLENAGIRVFEKEIRKAWDEQ